MHSSNQSRNPAKARCPILRECLEKDLTLLRSFLGVAEPEEECGVEYPESRYEISEYHRAGMHREEQSQQRDDDSRYEEGIEKLPVLHQRTLDPYGK